VVALAYVGAVVGAGFASGQEIYQFFSRHGTWGGLGLVTAGAAFFVLGALALEAGRRGAGDFRRFLASAYPPLLADLLDIVVTAFLALGLVVVVAAGGQDLSDLAGAPVAIGSLATLLAVMAVSAHGADSVLKANALLVPFLTAVAILVALLSPGRATASGAPGWWLSAGLYVSYNLFTGLMVLLGLGRGLKSRRDSVAAAGLAAVLLTVLGLVIHRSLLGLSAVAALPLMQSARGLGDAWAFVYGLALYAALFTTGVAEAFALFQRFGGRAWWAAMLWPASLFGFQALVSSLYPVMGAAAIVFWLPLLGGRQPPWRLGAHWVYQMRRRFWMPR
jgi:uncharacterized membrane protein YkvI